MTTEEQIIALFGKYDKDETGSVPKQVIQVLIQELDPDVSTRDFEKICQCFEVKRDGTLQYKDFIRFIFGTVAVSHSCGEIQVALASSLEESCCGTRSWPSSEDFRDPSGVSSAWTLHPSQSKHDLLENLDSKNPAHRKKAAKELSSLESDGDVITALLEHLKTDEDAGVRGMCATCLARLCKRGDKILIATLAELVRHRFSPWRPIYASKCQDAAISALGMVAEEGDPIAIAALASAINGARGLETEAATRGNTFEPHRSDDEWRTKAVEVLLQLDTRFDHLELAKFSLIETIKAGRHLETASGFKAQEVLLKITKKGDPDVIEGYLHLLRHPPYSEYYIEWKAQAAAAQFLGDFAEAGDPLALEGLRRFQHDKELAVRESVAAALEKLGETVDAVPYDPQGDILLNFLESADVALVRVWYLRELGEKGALLVRRQEIPPSCLVQGAELKTCVRDGCQVFAASHGWLTSQHPDPTGERLAELLEQLWLLGAEDIDLAFMDFCSCYQNNKMHEDIFEHAEAYQKGDLSLPADHPAKRTPEEDQKFRMAMRCMDKIYGSGISNVIILPTIYDLGHVDKGYFKNPTAYAERGWCRVEYSVSTFFGRVKAVGKGKLSPQHNELFENMDLTIEPKVVEKMIEDRKIRFTNGGDVQAVLEIFKRYFYAANKDSVIEAIQQGREVQVEEGIVSALNALDWRVCKEVGEELMKAWHGYQPCQKMQFEWRRFMTHMIATDWSDVRGAALPALSKIGQPGDKVLCAALAYALKTETDRSNKIQIANLITRIAGRGEKDATAALVDRLRIEGPNNNGMKYDDNYEVVVALGEALGKIAKPGDKEAVAALLDLWVTWASVWSTSSYGCDSVQDMAMEVLYKITEPGLQFERLLRDEYPPKAPAQAVGSLIPLLLHEQWGVRAATAQVLGNRASAGDQSVISKLQLTCDNDEEEQVRQVARDALIELEAKINLP